MQEVIGSIPFTSTIQLSESFKIFFSKLLLQGKNLLPEVPRLRPYRLEA